MNDRARGEDAQKAGVRRAGRSVHDRGADAPVQPGAERRRGRKGGKGERREESALPPFRIRGPHMLRTIASANSLVFTSFAPSMSRAKS